MKIKKSSELNDLYTGLYSVNEVEIKRQLRFDVIQVQEMKLH